MNRLVCTAISAYRKMTSAEASFSRLAPYSIDKSRLGAFTCLSTEVADTASGGEIIPPSKKPSAMVNPGMTALDTRATTSEVRITIRKAKLPMTLLHRHNSFQDVNQAAS